MYQSIFRNTERLTPNCADDEYDIAFRLFSLMVRLHLVEFDQQYDIPYQERELQEELDDFVQRCRISS